MQLRPQIKDQSKSGKAFRLASRDERGFTIFELMCVITIFAIMSTIVVFGFRNFGVNTQFDNLAQDVALHIVTAQNAAINGSLGTSTFGTVAPRYGVNFTSGTSANASDSQFIYFADLPGTTYNGKFDTTPGCGTVGSECISSTKITTGEYVDLISYVPPGGGAYTSVPAGTTANLTFTRPFPDASIIICTTSTSCYPPVSNVYIELAEPASPGDKKTIVVNALGAVRVYNGSTSCAYSGGSGC